MSTYLKKLINPNTLKEQVAVCADDFYGHHKYGYGFKKDGTDFSVEDFGKFDQCDFYPPKDITWPVSGSKSTTDPLGLHTVAHGKNESEDYIRGAADQFLLDEKKVEELLSGKHTPRKSTEDIFNSFCLEGKITEQHAEEIKAILQSELDRAEEEKMKIIDAAWNYVLKAVREECGSKDELIEALTNPQDNV